MPDILYARTLSSLSFAVITAVCTPARLSAPRIVPQRNRFASVIIISLPVSASR